MKKLLFMFMITTIIVLLGACGNNGGEEVEVSEDAFEVTITSTNWDFDEDTYTVPEGEVLINHVNGEGHHGIEIVGTGVTINGNGSAGAILEAGEYEIICSIPCGAGHRDMVATLVVQ
ncbi:cytochrome c oxidase subunit II [Evansella cellulosilytica]|uniref:Cytochrome c oxidase subunit II n=1 Tax=Evansella cellulosilytica (strain ATCC 21833 / DSM 2522 / FERM P-1141 / JCM 9156 / N-4) TaxID=649639 RepID=E6U0Z9_EVAC2|nr:cytochrome c oxidase subunit II [Evansella cellulosilytica]ADU30311.1 cytochrome c oxidase subunit II [Evansella cellulosilytica DSM 2522]